VSEGDFQIPDKSQVWW